MTSTPILHCPGAPASFGARGHVEGSRPGGVWDANAWEAWPLGWPASQRAELCSWQDAEKRAPSRGLRAVDLVSVALNLLMNFLVLLAALLLIDYAYRFIVHDGLDACSLRTGWVRV